MLQMKCHARAVDKLQAQMGNVRLTAMLHAGFILTGVVNTMLGPMLPVLSARWALSDAPRRVSVHGAIQWLDAGVMGSSFLMSRRAIAFR